MTDMMVCFRCCIIEQPQPQRRTRRQIDRSMIGAPTDFRHTGHVGAGEVGRSNGCSSLRSMQKQMSSKGGYEYKTGVNVEIKTSDINVRES